ncbi:MAG: extracellular solute-binding protein [Pseudomonadota bacterium]
MLHRQLSFAAVALASAFLVPLGPAWASAKKHGLSTFGDLKYPADFKHFSYVNPNAPKGGSLSTTPTSGSASFDSFNPFILKGNTPNGLSGLLFDTLLAGAGDELGAGYGLIAHSVELADDKRSVTFYMRPEAKFSDGTALTAEDAEFSITTLKTKGHPFYRNLLRDVVKGEALDKHTVRFTFKGDNLRDLPLLVGGLPIFSKAYYSKVDFTKTTLKEAPLGSGPYTLSKFEANKFVTYKRREDYWAKDLPVNVGTNNFDEVTYNYYKDRSASLIGFAGGEYDLREEFTSKQWATGYEFPAVKDGRVKLVTLEDKNPSGTQGWFFNTRRKKFSDPRVRQALGYTFDFEWTNKNLFYSLYTRTSSYFENSDMKAVGKPPAEELALLEPFKASLPKSVFDQPFVPPVFDGSGRNRKQLGKAHKLLKEAGFKLVNGKRLDPEGKQLSISFMRFAPSFDRILLPMVKNMKALGIDAKIEPVDPAQYELRRKNFDYDILSMRMVMSGTPGIELFNRFHSRAASANGSFNVAGIKDPAVDSLITKINNAKSRQELNTAVRALDRVLRAGHYWIPNWYKGAHNIALWDKFGRPETKPPYSRGIVGLWWEDKEKAAKLKRK